MHFANRDDLKRRLAFDTVCSRVYIRPTNIVPGTLRYPVDIPSLPADNLFPAIHQELLSIRIQQQVCASYREDLRRELVESSTSDALNSRGKFLSEDRSSQSRP